VGRTRRPEMEGGRRRAVRPSGGLFWIPIHLVSIRGELGAVVARVGGGVGAGAELGVELELGEAEGGSWLEQGQRKGRGGGGP